MGRWADPEAAGGAVKRAPGAQSPAEWGLNLGLITYQFGFQSETVPLKELPENYSIIKKLKFIKN